MNEEQTIEEILIEASAFGLRLEVESEAKKIINEDSKINKVLAYQIAFDEWIK